MSPFARHLATLPIFGLSLASFAALAQDQAGVSAGVRGDVQLASGQVGAAVRPRTAKSGDQIFLGDRIASGPDSGMQVLLLDETTFTVGADSQVTIDEFVYDPRSGNGKVSASIGKGVFRFVSGKVAQNEPRNMVVRTPVATIGIRGTAVWGDIGEDRAIIALAGPGKENNSGDKPGGIDIITPNGTVKIDRPGFGAEIIRGQAPRVIPIPPATAQRVLGALTRRSGGTVPVTPSGNPTSISGQSTAIALDDVLSSTRVEKTQTFGEVARVIAATEGTNMGAVTSFDDLRTVTGTGSYTVLSIPLSGTGGTGAYRFDMFIDYGARTTNSTFTISTPPGGYGFGSIAGGGNYASSVGEARFTATGTVGPSQYDGFYRFLNANGQAAANIEIGLTGSQAGTSVSGGTTIPR